MTVSLSIKNVPDELAERLRVRAARHHRSLQRELLAILEEVGAERGVDRGLPQPRPVPESVLSIDELAERARRLFPAGTPSSTAIIREMRDSRFGDPTSPGPRPTRRRGR